MTGTGTGAGFNVGLGSTIIFVGGLGIGLVGFCRVRLLSKNK
jgi:hypothetical protein